MNYSIYPSYEILYEDEYLLNKNRIPEGKSLDYIIYDEAMGYINSNIISPAILNYTKGYIQKYLINQTEILLMTNPQQLAELIKKQPQFAIIIHIKDQKLTAAIWSKKTNKVVFLNEDNDLFIAFNSSDKIAIRINNQDFLSPLARISIEAINRNNFTSTLETFKYSQLIKWAIAKAYRLAYMKEKGIEYSHFLDQVSQKSEQQQLSNSQQSQNELNLTKKSQKQLSQQQNSQLQNKKSPEISQLKSQKINESKSQQQLPSFNLEISSLHSQAPQSFQINNNKSQVLQESYTEIKNSINKDDLQLMLGNFKSQILNSENISQFSQQQKLKPINSYVTAPDKVFKIKLEDLEKILKEEVQQTKLPDNNAQDDLQNLLNYYYYNNQEQYKILLNKYQDTIHEQFFNNMGLSISKSPQLNFSQMSPQKPTIKLSQSNIQIAQKQGFTPTPYQEEIVAFNYNKKINRQEFELLKNKLMLTKNVMEFYLNYLNENSKRVLIMPLRFYEILSQSNYDKAKFFTNQYQGRNKTIFDQFDKIIIPVQISQYEYIGIYIDFLFKAFYYINTLESNNRRMPFYKNLIENPVINQIVRFIENEYNQKIMRAFDILNWKFIEFQNEYAQSFNHSTLVLTYVIDSICNSQNAQSDNKKLQELAQKIIDVIRKCGIKQ